MVAASNKTTPRNIRKKKRLPVRDAMKLPKENFKEHLLWVNAGIIHVEESRWASSGG